MLPELVCCLQAAQTQLFDNKSTVVVEVVSTRGSVPRNAGTIMLVDQHSVFGTIGGGHLESVAVLSARRFLLDEAPLPSVKEYPLGASFGQCCGGAMRVRFTPLTQQHVDALTLQISMFKTLYVFGSGHVAQALIPIVESLPLNIVWIDSRDIINQYQPTFPNNLASHITTIVTDTPEAELASSKAGDIVVVMTHSHSLDELIGSQALKYSSLAFIGLIGSATKRRAFEQRLLNKGFSQALLQKIECPIGAVRVNNTSAKLPAVIALQTAAQLTQFL